MSVDMKVKAIYDSEAYFFLFPYNSPLQESYLLNPFLPPVPERTFALSANFLWSANYYNFSDTCHITVNYANSFIQGFYHLAIADIYCHMADILISSVVCETVKDKITRLHFIIRYGLSCFIKSLCFCRCCSCSSMTDIHTCILP